MNGRWPIPTAGPPSTRSATSSARTHTTRYRRKVARAFSVFPPPPAGEDQGGGSRGSPLTSARRHVPPPCLLSVSRRAPQAEEGKWKSHGDELTQPWPPSRAA